MPRRTVDTGFIARVQVLLWASAPSRATRNQFEFDDAFGAEGYGHVAAWTLGRERHENGCALFQGRRYLGLAHDLGKMWRANFFFAFSHEHEVHGYFLPGSTHGVQRGQERGFRSFLIYGAPADKHFAEAGLVH